MKPEELKPCAGCGKGMMHSGDTVFYTMTLTQELINIRAVQQLHGMETMIGGAVGLARVLSPVREISAQVWTNTVLLCQPCLLIRGVDATMALPNSDDEETKR